MFRKAGGEAEHTPQVYDGAGGSLSPPVCPCLPRATPHFGPHLPVRVCTHPRPSPQKCQGTQRDCLHAPPLIPPCLPLHLYSIISLKTMSQYFHSSCLKCPLLFHLFDRHPSMKTQIYDHPPQEAFSVLPSPGEHFPLGSRLPLTRVPSHMPHSVCCSSTTVWPVRGRSSQTGSMWGAPHRLDLSPASAM